MLKKNKVIYKGDSKSYMNVDCGDVSDCMFLSKFVSNLDKDLKYFYSIELTTIFSPEALYERIVEKMKEYTEIILHGFREDELTLKVDYSMEFIASDGRRFLTLVRFIPGFLDDVSSGDMDVISSHSKNEFEELKIFLNFIEEIKRESKLQMESRAVEKKEFNIQVNIRDLGKKHDYLRVFLTLKLDYDEYYPLVNYTPIENIVKIFEKNLLQAFADHDMNRGKVIILEGPPGTGKTFFIKRMFSLLHHHNLPFSVDYYIGRATFYMSITDLYENAGDKKVRIVVMEEAEPIIVSQKGERSISLSKLLNYSSGLIDINTLFILSTNIPIDEIDPALIRDGRLLAHIKFLNFTKEEQVRAWCEFYGLDCEPFMEKLKIKKELSLSELYAIKKKTESIKAVERRVNVGFM